jgi:hypothetical protein
MKRFGFSIRDPCSRHFLLLFSVDGSEGEWKTFTVNETSRRQQRSKGESLKRKINHEYKES